MKNKKRIILIVCFTMVIALGSIGFGLYYNRLSKPKTIITKFTDEIEHVMTKYFISFDNYDVGDNFTITGNTKFNLDSEYYRQKGSTDVEFLKKYHLLKNLSSTKTTTIYRQDKKNNKAKFELKQTLGEEELVDFRFLIDNSTKYYFYHNIVPNYVNNGSCNYFEIFEKNATTRDNIEYLYHYFFTAIKDSLEDDYFDKYSADIKIDGKSINADVYTIKFNDKMLHMVLSNVLKEFQNDEKASHILNSIDPSFQKKKISNKDTFLGKKESYSLNIYTTKYTYKPLKYEIVHLNEDDKELFIYEGDFEKGNYFYVKNEKVVYQVPVSFGSTTISANINNTSASEIGYLQVEKNNHGLSFTYSFDNGTLKHEFIYSSKITKDDNKAIINNKKLSFKVVENKVSKVNGDIQLDLQIDKGAKIEADVSSAVLESSLTDEVKKLRDNQKDAIRAKLER